MRMSLQQSCAVGSSGAQDPQPSGLTTNTNPPWIQVPPSVMPWTMENRPQLVRFGETSKEADPWSLPPKLKYYKRKSDLDFNPKPSKMHITEEKMVAQLKNMHISNNYVGDQGFGDGMEEPSDCLLPTLVLSKEVQNLSTFQEPALPQSLLHKVEKPTRALMLWKPPAGSLTAQLIARLYGHSQEEVDNVNNNSATPDLNGMTSPGLSSTSTAMEL